jgi:hypothetical protein
MVVRVAGRTGIGNWGVPDMFPAIRFSFDVTKEMLRVTFGWRLKQKGYVDDVR